jgi:hypothetical protein
LPRLEAARLSDVRAHRTQPESHCGRDRTLANGVFKLFVDIANRFAPVVLRYSFVGVKRRFAEAAENQTFPDFAFVP